MPLTAPFVRNKFGSTGIPTLENRGWPIDQSIWNYTRPLNILNFTWVDLHDSTVNASIGAVFSIPYLLSVNHSAAFQSSMIVPCTIEARWIGSALVYDPSASTASDNVSQPLCFQHPDDESNYEAVGNKLPACPENLYATSIMDISMSWANMLNLPLPPDPEDGAFSPNTTINDLIYNLIQVNGNYSTNASSDAYYYPLQWNSDLNKYRRSMAKDLASILGMYVADGLSRIQYVEPDIRVISQNTTATVNWTTLLFQAGKNAKSFNGSASQETFQNQSADWPQYQFTVERWGYGYGLNTRTSQFGMSILLIYAALVIGYLLWYYVFISLFRPKSDWALTSKKWSSIGELLALAINSPPSIELDGTCAGIGEGKIWANTVAIRDVGDQHLAVVVGDSKDSHLRVRRGAKYGSLSSEQ
jgi:hypothetical protein